MAKFPPCSKKWDFAWWVQCAGLEKKLDLIVGRRLRDLIFACVRRPPCTAKAVQRNLAECASGTQGAAQFLLKNCACSLT